MYEYIFCNKFSSSSSALLCMQIFGLFDYFDYFDYAFLTKRTNFKTTELV